MPKNHVPAGGRGIDLEITQEIINAAIPRDSSHCVLADAIRLAIPEARRVSVDLQTIRFTSTITNRRYVYLTPASGQSVLVKFDQGVYPEPFTMRLGRPIQTVRAGRRPPADAPEDEKALANANRVRGSKRTISSNGTNKAPTVHGGKLPPSAALSSTRGRRRTFGIKQLRP